MFKNELKELSKCVSFLDLGNGYELYLPYYKKNEKIEIYKLKGKTDEEALKEINNMNKNNDFEIKNEPQYIFRHFYDNYDELWEAEIPIGKIKDIILAIDNTSAYTMQCDEIV